MNAATPQPLLARAAAFSALQPLGGDAATLPQSLQWMPPGHQTFTLMDHPGKVFEINVTPAVAEAANTMLQQMHAQAASGQGALPYADKNHKDDEAVFTPKRFFWGGDDPKTGGVRVEPDWHGFGEQLVKARAFRYFSPSFLFDAAAKKFLRIGRNIGGLVNDPGFPSIQAFARAGASLPQPQTPQHAMTPEEKAQVEALQSSVTKLTDTVTALDSALKAQAKAAPTTDPKIAGLEAKIAVLEADKSARETERGDSLRAHAKACVEKGIKQGRISPQDEGSKKFWEDCIVANAKAADELEKLPVNPAFTKIVQGNQQTTQAGTPAEQFVVLVRAKAGDGKKPGETHVQAAITERPDLYKAWRDANGQPGL